LPSVIGLLYSRNGLKGQYSGIRLKKDVPKSIDYHQSLVTAKNTILLVLSHPLNFIYKYKYLIKNIL